MQKVGQQWRRCGILKSRREAHGGYGLARPAEEVTVLGGSREGRESPDDRPVARPALCSLCPS
jgi:hypothetical protein